MDLEHTNDNRDTIGETAKCNKIKSNEWQREQELR